MAARPTWIFWVRGSLVAAICGHWLANTVLDPDQYTQAGLSYTWRASLPLVVQTILVIVALVAVEPLSRAIRGSRSRRSSHSSPFRLLVLVMTSQLLLFLLMEISERIYQREPFTEGLLASGFVLELSIALVSSFLLIGLGSIVWHTIRSPRRRPTSVTVDDRIDPISHRSAPALALIVVGDVRAPPLAPTSP